MSIPNDPGLIPEIHLSETVEPSVYDCQTFQTHQILAELPDGHQLVQSYDGWLYSQRMVTDNHGNYDCDVHGMFAFARHLGESDEELIERWKYEAMRGVC